MVGKIFVNYRRSQSLQEAQHLATILGSDFGAKRVFIDVRSIDGFSDWFEILRQQVEGTGALIVLIGKDWLAALDKQEYSGRETTKDFVRFEITEALKRNIPVLPVLLDGATLPNERELPIEICGLLRRQAMGLRGAHFPEDAAAISDKLRSILAEMQQYRKIGTWKIASLLATALTLGVVIGGLALNAIVVQPLRERIAPLDEVRNCVATVRSKLDEQKFEPDILVATSGGDAILSILLSKQYDKAVPVYLLYDLPPGFYGHQVRSPWR